jgi:methionyl-tRNA formyltransferase
MRIVFMGTPEFAIPSLNILLDNQYPVVSVVTVPDKPQGRGQKFIPSPVKKFSLQHHLPVLQPESLNDRQFIAQLQALQPDLFIVVAFRILPNDVFTIPKLGAFNLHASLLPKYRGAAPIQWAIINGEQETGVTTFFLEKTVDTGNIILQARVPIGPDETYGELYRKLADVGAEIVLHTVRLIEAGKTHRILQKHNEATPAPKIHKEHCRIDWTKPAQHIHNLVRGLSPSPGAFTTHGEKTIKMLRTKIVKTQSDNMPGQICETEKKLVVCAGRDGVEILEIQLEGKRKMTAEEFLRGYQLTRDDRLV